MMVELTDETNIGRGFSMIPMSNSFGYAIGCVAHPIRHLAPSLKSMILVLSSGACYHDHKIVGHASFRTLSGPNTHISFHASWLLPVAAPR
jgi:hypothetical protein